MNKARIEICSLFSPFLRHTPRWLSLTEGPTSGADVILTGANITLLHYAYADVEPNVLNEVSVPLEERFFRLPSGERTAN